MNRFFTADPHFGHKNIIEFCDRPFDDIADMNETLIDNWNNTVGLNDEVYMLGDICFGRTDYVDVIPRLNGRIFLVKGNHDKKTPQLPRDGFYQVYDYKEIKVWDYNVVMLHYPMERWNKMGYGCIHLHGHTHGTCQPAKNRMDVGIDNHPEYRPFHWDEVLEKIQKTNMELFELYNGVNHTGE